MLAAQEAEWRDSAGSVARKNNRPVNEEGISVMVTKTGPVVIIPRTLRPEAPKRVHGDADAGHFGLADPALTLKA